MILIGSQKRVKHSRGALRSLREAVDATTLQNWELETDEWRWKDLLGKDNFMKDGIKPHYRKGVFGPTRTKSQDSTLLLEL